MTELTLMLTPWYLPHKVLRWQDAVTLIYLEKVDIIVEYGGVIRSPSMEMRIPAVIRVRRALSRVNKGIKFSRINVYTRDKFTCQYCDRKCEPHDLSYDHVIPRAKGGRTEWTNIVTACKPCNNRKAARSTDESGMWPRNPAVKPKTLPMAKPRLKVCNAPAEWHAFLGTSSS